VRAQDNRDWTDCVAWKEVAPAIWTSDIEIESENLAAFLAEQAVMKVFKFLFPSYGLMKAILRLY
jgi:hypothetical protein